MKITLLIFAIFSTLFGSSQSIVGTWSGVLRVQSTELRVVFHIAASADSLLVTMDSPDQGGYGIKSDRATFEDSTLMIATKSLNMGYSGTLKSDDRIEGVFRQGFAAFPLVLTRGVVAKRVREQDPVKPYPYREEQVSFENEEDSVTLAGTLTLPLQGDSFAAVVLVSGSGPQNRDEELMGHRPFAVLADYLTRNGIAVLRYDDRGVGESSGDFSKATTRAFARDAHSAVRYLATRADINKIGIIGHSEGGLIAPMVAADHPRDLAFIVMMAGHGVAGDSIILMQSALIAQKMGVSAKEIERSRNVNRTVYSMIKCGAAVDSIRAYLKKVVPEVDEKTLQGQLKTLTSAWYREFLMTEPADYLSRVKCSVLALNGELDLQVPSNENLTSIDLVLSGSGNKNFQIVSFPHLNHLFQECQTGLPSEYADIEQTISPTVMQRIAQWISTVTSAK